jgi:hypothetical protein
MDNINYWRLNDDLNIIEAALLVIGEDPSSLAPYVEDANAENQPQGYVAARNGIAGGLRKGLIIGSWVHLDEVDWNGNVVSAIKDSMNFEKSRVDVDSLKLWLLNRGISDNFFFPAVAPITGPDYLNQDHPRYVATMAASIKAWLAMEDENLLRGKNPKQAIISWAESRYKELGLFHEKDDPKNKIKAGDINKTAIEKVAIIANWRPGGGSPNTPG